jgi:hypothetical protein
MRAGALEAKVLIPGKDKVGSVFHNEIVQLSQLRAAKASRIGQLNGLQPELGVSLRLLNVDVRRFISLSAEEEKSIAMNSQHLWH